MTGGGKLSLGHTSAFAIIVRVKVFPIGLPERLVLDQRQRDADDAPMLNRLRYLLTSLMTGKLPLGHTSAFAIIVRVKVFPIGLPERLVLEHRQRDADDAPMLNWWLRMKATVASESSRSHIKPKGTRITVEDKWLQLIHMEESVSNGDRQARSNTRMIPEYRFKFSYIS
ncbi:hypothetical protein K435DRAFT_810007 [Dendrothele bispora CBS 962.96]|uniref:Uncharacterized protein n=1 Tax=Dendrothele bispora (strain CBS 962.96) TaxID=1314807 RepID=A0A4S8KWE1_DENBC|nr:hypothetical protein K435DRAFT_810007 [Dendrothele bispora CBS 962.96]